MDDKMTEFEAFLARDEGVTRYGLELRESYRDGAEAGWKAALAQQPRISESELVDIIIRGFNDCTQTGNSVDLENEVAPHIAREILAKLQQIREGV